MELTDDEIKLVEELSKVMAEMDALSKDNAKDKLEDLISEMMFGPGIPDKRTNISWEALFKDKTCPICAEKIILKEDVYESGKCGLKIGRELYEKAEKDYKKENELDDSNSKLRKRMDGMKLNPTRITEIYKLAIERSTRVGNEEKR
jgi:hypothetical protein